MRRGRLLLVAVALAATVITLCGTQPAGAATVKTRAAAAVAYARRHHMTSGIAVLDTRTGSLHTSGRARRYFASASVVKTLIATRLLLAGKMRGRNAELARAMITRSDNAAAWTLYPKVGRDRLLPWVARHYKIRRLGARPSMRGIWGSTRITARGMVRFYAAVRADPKVWPWLSRAMHAYHRLSSAGEPNAFGIAAAARKSAVKNGWDVDRDVKAPSNAIINSTGFVQGDRYAVAILAEGPGYLYFRRGEHIVTREARILLPAGRVTLRAG